jgi:hypothetical protein
MIASFQTLPICGKMLRASIGIHKTLAVKLREKPREKGPEHWGHHPESIEKTQDCGTLFVDWA